MRKTAFGKLGFTLIEMMVSVTVIALITSIGVPRYRQFNNKQEVVTAGKELVQIFRTAQKRAKSGQKGDGCDALVLDGYRVTLPASSPSVVVDMVCDGGATVIPISNQTFKADVLVGTGGTVMFGVVTEGVTFPVGTGAVSVEKNNIEYEVQVTTDGSINDVGIVDD